MLSSFLYPIGLPIAVSLVAYNSFLTGLMTVFKRRDSVGIRYWIFSFLVFLWGVGISFMMHNELPNSIAESWGRFAQTVALLIPVTWLHFVASYTKKTRECSKLLWLLYGVAFAILPFSLSDWFVQDYREMVLVKRYPMPGPLYVVFTASFAAGVLYSFRILYLSWRQARGTERSLNYKWLFIAQLYGFTTGGLSFLPVYGIPLPQYNLLIMPLWQIFLAYAIVRHRLMDYEEGFVQAAHRDKLAAIGTIATSINHEIRNPLYIIHGMAESFLHNFRGEETNLAAVKKESMSVLEKTAHQAKRAMEIMSQLSMFAKQQQGDVLAAVGTANLQECLSNVLPLVRHEMTLDRITLENHLPHDLPSIKANPRQIEEILFNLIVNACQALKTEGGSITVSATHVGQKVELILEDNGPGIAQSQLKKIFEPFYTTKDEGTGLGLYIVKQFVEKNGGKIFVESKDGLGARFVLELVTC